MLDQTQAELKAVKSKLAEREGEIASLKAAAALATGSAGEGTSANTPRTDRSTGGGANAMAPQTDGRASEVASAMTPRTRRTPTSMPQGRMVLIATVVYPTTCHLPMSNIINNNMIPGWGTPAPAMQEGNGKMVLVSRVVYGMDMPRVAAVDSTNIISSKRRLEISSGEAKRYRQGACGAPSQRVTSSEDSIISSPAGPQTPERDELTSGGAALPT
jgi:hypothetical protein